MTKLLDASGFRVGGSPVDKIYLGSEQLYALAQAGVITITQQPTDQSATVGGDATFSVTAVVEPAGTLAYQWQEFNDSAGTGMFWTDATPLEPASVPAAESVVAYGNGAFVAVGHVSGNSFSYSSPDGRTWIKRHNLPANEWGWDHIAYVDGKHIATNKNTMPNVAISDDGGATWSAGSGLPGGGNWQIAFLNGIFLAVDTGSRFQNIFVSTDGVSWSAGTSLPTGNLSVVAGGGVFVVSGNAERVWRGSDGINWSESSIHYGSKHLAYGNGIFVALASPGSGGDLVSTSTDGGATWLTHSVDFPEIAGYGVATALLHDGYKFVAITYNYHSATSFDGVSWLFNLMPDQTGPSGGWWSLAHDGNDTFVALSYRSARVAIGMTMAGEFADIPGATSSTLLLSDLTESDDGSQHRVVVSAPGATSVTSDVATLTVEAAAVSSDPLFSDVIALYSFDEPAGTPWEQWENKAPFNGIPLGPFGGGATFDTQAAIAKYGNGALVSQNWPAILGSHTGTSALQLGDDFTVEVWFLNSLVPDEAYTSHEDTLFEFNQSNRLLILLRGSAGQNTISLHDPSGFVFAGTVSYRDEQWHHLAIDRNNGVVSVYVDGARLGTALWSDTLTNLWMRGSPFTLSYWDEYRVTAASRYSGESIEVPTGPFPTPLTAVLPAAVTAYGGAATLAVQANVYAGEVATYQWEKQEGGAGAFVAIAGATASTLPLSDLTDADDTGDVYRVSVSIAGRGTAVSNAAVLTVDESGINADNRFRVTTAASTTALTAAVESTTGYWKMVSSTGQESAVIGSQWSQYSPYYFLTGTVSGMPSGVEKTVEIFSCDASGNPSGELEYVSFAPSSQAITTADASGCTSLRGFNLSSSATPYGSWYGVSTLPAALVSVRAVGVIGSGGMYSQWGPNPANVTEGINVAGQTLSAAALNQLYEDLGNGTNSARIFVPGNPGTAEDNESIATGKGYTIFGS
jgi:hypothetical protein